MSGTLARGSKLGDYEVVRAIQSGGMGDVLLARKRGMVGFEKLFAIKTMRSDLRDIESVRTMFADEARLLSRLAHPAIAQVHDFGEQDGLLYLVMEYVAGIGFRELMDLDPGPGIVCRALAEACHGLHAAHEVRDLGGHSLGVVHRDVSPENLMLSFEGRVKVLDFGIALVRGRQAPVTEFGTIKGKPPYLAPEQVKGEAVDRRTDVFASSVVLYEMLTGEQLFAGSSVYAIARAIEHRDIPPPSAIVGALPVGLDELVLRGLERNPAERFQTAQLMAEELARVAVDAGAESLDSYALRELSGLRERHRDELRAVLAGAAESAVRARPTGSVTALAETLSQPLTAADAANEEARAGASEAPGGDLAGTANALPPVGRDTGTALDKVSRATPPGDSNIERAAGGEATTMSASQEAHKNGPQRRWLALALLGSLLGGGLLAVYLAVHLSGDETRERRADTRLVRSDPETPAPVDAQIPPTVIATPIAKPAQATEAPEQKDSRLDVREAPVVRPQSGSSARTERRERSTTKPAKQPARRAADRHGDRTGEGAEALAKDTRNGANRPVASAAKKTGEQPADPPAKRAEKPSESTEQTPSEPKEFGRVTILADPYAQVSIDGKHIGSTPIFDRPLPAGRHEVVLVSPKTDEVRLRRTFDLGAGGTERIFID